MALTFHRTASAWYDRSASPRSFSCYIIDPSCHANAPDFYRLYNIFLSNRTCISKPENNLLPIVVIGTFAVFDWALNLAIPISMHKDQLKGFCIDCAHYGCNSTASWSLQIRMFASTISTTRARDYLIATSSFCSDSANLSLRQPLYNASSVERLLRFYRVIDVKVFSIRQAIACCDR